jgi:pimeloyl-ACP methyl ester carboxylesterase
MRGFGRSEMVEGPYAHHLDLLALLDALGVERAHLVGCSIGGRTAVDFTLEYPGRVRSLVLVGSAIGGAEIWGDPPDQWEELVSADNAGDLGRVSELEVQIWVDGPTRSPDLVNPGVRDLVREMNLIALRNEASGLGDEGPLEPPSIDRLDEIRVPTLVIVGELDRPETVARAETLERSIPGARRIAMPGVAHVPNMERPAEFNRIALVFLEGEL